MLGTLLFFIYIYDLPNLSKLLSCNLLSDDINSDFESKDLPKLVQVVNKELSRVKSWLDYNKLTLKINKNNLYSSIHL